MTKHLLPALVAMLLVLSTGCTLFKKSGRTRENSAIASEVEETYRKRWVEKRAGDLVAQGTSAEAARIQAENEFREKYGFNQAGRK